MDDEAAEGSSQVTILDQFINPVWTSNKRYIVLSGGAGSGKLVPASTRIVTPYGYKTMGDLQVGDNICSTEGGITQVIAKYKGDKKRMYRLTFEDGRTCIAGEEHLWNYAIGSKRYKDGSIWKVASTQQLLDMMTAKKNNLRKKNLSIPLPEPVAFAKARERLIAPYLLGLLLGDGYLSETIALTTVDDEIKQWVLSNSKPSSRYDKPTAGSAITVFSFSWLKPQLERLGLYRKHSYDKFIPNSYMQTSIEDRREILRGLLDTDGTVRVGGTIGYSTVSKQLADDVAWLVRSLGGKATITPKLPTYTSHGEKKQGRLAYTLYIRFKDASVPMFKLTRKQNRVKPYNGGISELKLGISSIELIDCPEDTYCISVAHPNSLYMIEDFIVTHNSHAVADRFAWLFLNRPKCIFFVGRATLPSLKLTAYLGEEGVIEALKRVGVYAEKWGWLNKSEKTLTNPSTGSKMYFSQIDDPEKIKSLNLNYIWLEEATDLDVNKFAQLDTRLRAPPACYQQMFLTYNPISYNNWVVQQFQINPTPYYSENSLVATSNFLQNPYLGMSAIRALLERAKHDSNYYYTYVLGQPSKPLGQVYSNIMQAPAESWPEDVWNIEPYYGVDWGYEDPMVLIELRDYDGVTYCRCLYYRNHQTVNDLADFMHALSIPANREIFCDSASPDRIDLLAHLGYPNAQKALSKDIGAGITCLQGSSMVIDNSGDNGRYFADELGGYTYQTDPLDSSKFIEGKPVDANNHAMDAMRYGKFSHYLRSHGFSVESFTLNAFTEDLKRVYSKDEPAKASGGSIVTPKM